MIAVLVFDEHILLDKLTIQLYGLIDVQTFNQLTSFNFKSKSIHILKTHAINIPIPWTYKCIQMRLCFILSLHYNISCVVLDSFLASFHEAISIVDW